MGNFFDFLNKTPQKNDPAGLSKASDKVFADPSVRNLMLGETVHAKNAFFGQLRDPATLDSFQRNRVTDIGLELPKGMQPLADGLAAKTISRETFIEEFRKGYKFFELDGAYESERRNQIADLIEGAGKRGIRVHFIDQMQGIKMLEHYAGNAPLMARFESCLNDGVNKLPPDRRNAIESDARIYDAVVKACVAGDPEIRQMRDEIEASRFRLDRAMGQELEANGTPGGRRVAFFGSAHVGIAEGLSGKTVGVAGVYPGNSMAVREVTPFYTQHFDIGSGQIIPDPRLAAKPPAPAFSAPFATP